jgi:hypothetical protein
MKNLSKSNCILLFIILQTIFYTSVKAQYCMLTSTLTPLTGVNYYSKNGYHAPTTGTYRVLLIFVEAIYPPQPPTPAIDPDPYRTGTVNWPINNLPVWKDDLFDPTIGTNKGEFTNFYRLASHDRLIVLGDILLSSTNNGIFQIPSTSIANMGQIFNAVNTQSGGKFVTQSGLSKSDFDSWTSSSPGVAKTMSPDPSFKYDIVMVIYRNAAGYHGGNGNCNDSPSQTALLFGSPTSTFIQMGGQWDGIPRACATHEFGHTLFGNNFFHTAGYTLPGYNDYWVNPGHGWGIMGLYANSVWSFSGWDRLQMGWNTPGTNYNPAARDESNSGFVDGDVNSTNVTPTGIYYLRDFVTSGDAIRIKLPYTNPSTEYNEYIWIENHATSVINGVPFDKFQFEGATCVSGMVPGLYLQMQIHRDVLEGTNPNDIYNGYGCYLNAITADGRYDREYEKTPMAQSCVSTADARPFIRNPLKENPLTGCNDQELTAFNENPVDNELDFGDDIENCIEKDSGKYTSALYALGHSRHAFTLAGNKKVGMGTNPSTATRINEVGNNDPQSGSKNVLSTYLNGISIEILNQYSNGDAKIKIRFDDVDISNDVRWCSPSIVLNEITTSTGYSLNLKSGKKITLDQGLTPTKMENPIIINEEQIFASPTVMTVKQGAKINMESNSEIIVDNNSTLKFEANSRIDIKSGAILRVKRGGKLVREGNAIINVKKGGRIIIENDGSYDQ